MTLLQKDMQSRGTAAVQLIAQKRTATSKTTTLNTTKLQHRLENATARTIPPETRSSARRSQRRAAFSNRFTSAMFRLAARCSLLRTCVYKDKIENLRGTLLVDQDCVGGGASTHHKVHRTGSQCAASEQISDSSSLPRLAASCPAAAAARGVVLWKPCDTSAACQINMSKPPYKHSSKRNRTKTMKRKEQKALSRERTISNARPHMWFARMYSAHTLNIVGERQSSIESVTPCAKVGD